MSAFEPEENNTPNDPPLEFRNINIGMNVFGRGFLVGKRTAEEKIYEIRYFHEIRGNGENENWSGTNVF